MAGAAEVAVVVLVVPLVVALVEVSVVLVSEVVVVVLTAEVVVVAAPYHIQSVNLQEMGRIERKHTVNVDAKLVMVLPAESVVTIATPVMVLPAESVVVTPLG